MTGNNKISRSWMSSLRLWTIGPVAEFLHETTKGSKKVGIGVQKHQVWWKSRDSWWMLPKTLVESTTRFCSKKKRDFWFCFTFCQIYSRVCIPFSEDHPETSGRKHGVYPLLHLFQEAVWDRAAHPRLPEKHSGTQGWDGTRGRKMQSLRFPLMAKMLRVFSFQQPSRIIVRQSTWRRGIAILQPFRCWWTATEKDRTDETQNR